MRYFDMQSNPRPFTAYLSSLSLACLATATLCLWSCSGGSPSGVPGTSGNFVVLQTEPAANGRLFLNDPIRIDFSNQVDIATANLNAVSFSVFDAQGNPLSERPTGTFRLARSPGDTEIGRRLEFVPRLPTNNAYTNGGFRASRTYLVELVGGQGGLRDVNGNRLASPMSFQVRTATGATPSELFRDTKVGGPRRVGFSVTSDALGAALLNKTGQTPVVVTLQLNQPLNPHSDNVPVDLDIDPETRSSNNRGRIFLEYADTELSPPNVWIPAKVVLTRNDLEGSEVQMFPLGVFPNDAEVRVIVEKTLEDMSGESNVPDASYDPLFATFRTQTALAPQFDAVVDSFDDADLIDLDAAFLEPVAELDQGFVRANFDFEGSSTILNYNPNSAEVILNTDFTQITPEGAPPINVSQGIFQFNNVTIRDGVTVRGIGSNPMVWLVTGNFTVDGVLSVDGGNGERVDTLMSANFPSAGGTAVCGSGRGGRGSPNSSGQSPSGEAGFGPGQVPGRGGTGGLLGLVTGCGRGSGGGGGTFATQGDPFFKVKAQGGTSFIQQKGGGGWGCNGESGSVTRNLAGGNPGAPVFVDPAEDNNFWGSAVSVQRQVRITGELAAPQGGSGGGGGGNLALQLGNKNWQNNNKGGGGGAGGGVLIIKALGSIRIGPNGRITANGGHGGGGEQAGSNNQGGGGGGGAGGMVVLMAGEKIRISTHGETYANGDFDFAIAADGGVGLQGAFGGFEIAGKYPPPSKLAPTVWDQAPTGGMGGLGIVQLMAPAGDDQEGTTGTGTVLDDNIDILLNGVPITDPIDKQRYLAWRGFQDESGIWVDDEGNPTYANPPSTPGYPAPPAGFAQSPDDEGDIRPAPILLPAPFGHKSRVRTNWIDVGVGAVRLPVQQFGSGPRRIQEDPANNLLRGPRYEFSGTNADTGAAATQNWVGYINYDQLTGELAPAPEVLPRSVAIAVIDPNDTFQGQPAYRVELTQAVLGTVVDRYSQYQARLDDPAQINPTTGRPISVGSYRVLSHDSRAMWLSPDQGALPASLVGLELQLVARFFDVRTDGNPGLGPVTTSLNGVAPKANVQIGFAFHVEPAVPIITSSGDDLNRLPNQPGTFLYTLSDPVVQEQVRTFKGEPSRTTPGAAFAMWDILFNTRYSEDEPGNTRASEPLSPSNPRPELHFLVLPYRY